MKRFFQMMIYCLFLFPFTSYAIGWQDLVNAIANVYGVNLKMKDLDAQSLDQLKSLHDTLNGTHTYGGRAYDSNRYEWGTNNWQELLSLSHGGGRSGEMAEMVSKLARDFPMDEKLNSPNETENEYYRLQAQTALASRAASQVAYQQAIREEKTMQKLHDEIDRAPDQKSATDLNNRLVAESAMNAVQQTKLLAVLAEQSALNAQEKVNRAKEDKAFFDMK